MLLSVLLTLAIILTTSGCSTQTSPESSNEPESAHEAINISWNSTYETMLFDTGYVHMIDITISENDWTDLNANPTAKTKYETNVTIDGVRVMKRI